MSWGRFVTALAGLWILLVVVGGVTYRHSDRRWTVLLATGLGLIWLPFAALPLLAGVLRRRLGPIISQRADRQRVLAELPDAVDLLLVAIQAGLSPELALARVGPMLDGPVGRACAAVFERLDHGERFGEAIEQLQDDLGDAARPLVAALAGAERYGLALAPALDTVALAGRDLRRRAAETAARRLPVRLSFPLVLCILPAFVILTVVPAILGAVRALP